MNNHADTIAATVLILVSIITLSAPAWLPLWWAYALPCVEDMADGGGVSHGCWSPAHVIVWEQSRPVCRCAP